MADLMDQTFDKRRKEIVGLILSIKKALVTYPALKTFQGLRREFERITQRKVTDFNVDNFERNLKGLFIGQIGREGSTCTNKYCRESQEILRQDFDQDNFRQNTARVILFGCAQTRATWWDSIVKMYKNQDADRGIGRPQPTLLVDETEAPFGANCAEVYCDKDPVVVGVSFYEGILTCYYLYYVFNLEYPNPKEYDDHLIFQWFDKLRSLRSHE